jgi:two-component system sensor histidine kinase YesM
LVKARLRNGGVIFSVRDNGRGMSAEEISALERKLSVSREGLRGFENIALLNIKNRLHYYFGDAGQLSIQQPDGGGAEVSIKIPLVTEAGGLV